MGAVSHVWIKANGGFKEKLPADPRYNIDGRCCTHTPVVSSREV